LKSWGGLSKSPSGLRRLVEAAHSGGEPDKENDMIALAIITARVAHDRVADQFAGRRKPTPRVA
jgi:hypothetical protein